MKVSIVIPVYNMENGAKLLARNLDSIRNQSFNDYEIVISDGSNGAFNDVLNRYKVRIVSGREGMAQNTNNAIDNAQGDLVKILFQDDYFYNQDSLGLMIHHFTPQAKWMVTSCTHTFDGVRTFNDHNPYYTERDNTIGSPSVMIFKREIPERFDPEYKWVLDLDLYKRLFRKYGLPKVLNKVLVVIGIHAGQMTHKLSDQEKIKEHQILEIKKKNI